MQFPRARRLLRAHAAHALSISVQVLATRVADAQDHKGLDVLALDFIGASDDSRFSHGGMADQRAFNVGGANAMAGDVQHIVRATDYGEVAVLIAHGDIARGISVGNFAQSCA